MILPPRESASRRCSGLQNARRLKQGIHSLGHRVSYASRSTFRKSSGFQLLQWNTAKNAKMDGWNTTDDRFGTTLKTSLLSSSIFAKVWFLYVFVGRLPWKSWSTCPTWPTYSSVAGVRAPGCRSGGRQCSRMPNHTPQLTLGLSPEPLSTFSDMISTLLNDIGGHGWNIMKPYETAPEFSRTSFCVWDVAEKEVTASTWGRRWNSPPKVGRTYVDFASSCANMWKRNFQHIETYQLYRLDTHI